MGGAPFASLAGCGLDTVPRPAILCSGKSGVRRFLPGAAFPEPFRAVGGCFDLVAAGRALFAREGCGSAARGGVAPF